MIKSDLLIKQFGFPEKSPYLCITRNDTGMNEKRIRKYIEENFDQFHSGKHHLLMLFETEMELGISTQPNRWECTGVKYFTNGLDALNAYANIPNPASQLIDAETKEGLIQGAMETLRGMKDKKWLDENLYPYL